MDNKPNKLLYPMLLVAAFSVTAFSMVGIATMTGKIPSAQADVLDAAPPALPRYGSDDKPTPAAAANAAGKLAQANKTASGKAASTAAAPCNSCGVVETIRVVERKGDGSGLGAVAGGVAGAAVGSQIGGGNGRTAMAVLGGVGGAFAGHEIEKNVKKTTAYEIKVRMDDGSVRVRTQSAQPAFAVGDKVRYDNGSFTQRS